MGGPLDSCLEHLNKESRWENCQLAAKSELKSWERCQDAEGLGNPRVLEKVQ